MILSSFLPRCISALLFVWSAAAFFVVTQPAKDAQWVNGQNNVLTWEKGLLDGIVGYDVELTRMSKDGLILVAKNVPAKPGGLNIYIENVPAGDDYVVIFINSTHGVLQGTSERFSILAASATPTSTATPIPADKNAATVTVTTGPNPTAFFATTFPALPWSAGERRVGVVERRALVGLGVAVVLGVCSAGWVLL